MTIPKYPQIGPLPHLWSIVHYHHTEPQPMIASMKHPSQTCIQNHCTMWTVYKTPPEPAKPNNPFNAQPNDTPYLTPTGLPHFKNLTVQQKLPKRLNDAISSLMRRSIKSIPPRQNELMDTSTKPTVKLPCKTLPIKIRSDKPEHLSSIYLYDSDLPCDEQVQA